MKEFKRTSDQRHTYRERGESRARAQHDVLVRSLEKVAEETEGENRGWKIKLIIFVGGTCGSVHTQTFNNNLKELGVVESKEIGMWKKFFKGWTVSFEVWSEAAKCTEERRTASRRRRRTG